MHLIFAFLFEEAEPLNKTILVVVLVALLLLIVFRQTIDFVEFVWIQYFISKPFFTHFYFKKSKLTPDQLYILETDFSFYQKLNHRKKTYFAHRVATFIAAHSFTGKSGVYVSNRHKVLIAATAIMLTFGYRTYLLKTLERFIIYPDAFYSTINKNLHKGEFNPAHKAIVFSWKDFLIGYKIDDDNFNLGIHEMVHAMHFEYLKPSNTSTSALIFMKHYNKMKKFLNQNTNYKQRLVSSKYLRSYAYTNNFEFIAVLIESFIETPTELKAQFPEIYNHVKNMLNFDFPGY